MSSARWKVLVACALSVIVLANCSKKDKDAKKYVQLAEFISPQDSFPRLRYFESSLVTINDRCAVRKTRLNPRMPAVYVNGQPVGFC